MVKTKAPAPKRAKMNDGSKRVVARVPRSIGLTKPELDHARQLVDPCEAPLRAPVYGGSEGSAIIRLKGVTAYNSGPTGNQPYGVVFYHPHFGTYSMTGLVTGGTFGYDSDLSPQFTGTTLPIAGNSAVPGRAISGCLKVRFLGAELNRSGKIGMGVVPGQFVWEMIKLTNGGGGVPYTNDQVFGIIEHTARMPLDGSEICWMPGAIDEEFSEPFYYNGVSSPSPQLEDYYSRTNFVVLAWQGVGTATCPVEVEITSIVERFFTFPITADGGRYVVTAGKRSGGSTGAVTKVIQYLQSRDSRWYINAAMKASKLLTGISSVMRGDLVGMVGAMGIGANRNRLQLMSA